MPVVAERKALFARRDLVDQLIDIANKKGMSLYNLVNDVFESYIKIVGTDAGFERLREETSFQRRASSAGFILTPRALVLSALREYYALKPEEALRLGAQAGSWLARYYISLNTPDPLPSLLKDLEKAFAWIGDLTIRLFDNKVEAVIATPETVEHSVAKILLALLEGALSEFKYRMVQRTEVSGVLKAAFEKRC